MVNSLITIKEIAKLADVSSATVSRVVNNTGYVSDAVREKVTRIVEQYEYVPSESAKTLRTKKSKIIGVILPKIGTETTSRIVNGINETLSAKGYQMVLASTDLDPANEIKFIKLLRNRQVDGIILNATSINEPLIKEINNLDIPFTTIGQDIPGTSVITYNNYEVAKGLTEYLINKGHHKIGFIGVEETDPAVGQDRKKGYLDAMKEHSLSVEDNWMHLGNFEMNTGEKSAELIMSRSLVKPTAIFAVTDRLAIGAMKWLRLRYKIPREVAIVGIGASEMGEIIEPALTTVDFKNEEAGKEAAHSILQQISGTQTNPIKMLLNYRLIERDSV